VIFLLAARDDVHGVFGNGLQQLEGLGRVGVAPSVAWRHVGVGHRPVSRIVAPAF
jgi:hypothetical protein